MTGSLGNVAFENSWSTSGMSLSRKSSSEAIDVLVLSTARGPLSCALSFMLGQGCLRAFFGTISFHVKWIKNGAVKAVIGI